MWDTRIVSSISSVSLSRKFCLNRIRMLLLSKQREYIVISIESYIKKIKLSDLESKVLITGNLEYDYYLVISKN